MPRRENVALAQSVLWALVVNDGGHLLQPRGMLIGVVPTEQQLATGGQHCSDGGSGPATVAPIGSGQGCRGRQRSSHVILPSDRHRDGGAAWCRCAPGISLSSEVLISSDASAPDVVPVFRILRRNRDTHIVPDDRRSAGLFRPPRNGLAGPIGSPPGICSIPHRIVRYRQRQRSGRSMLAQQAVAATPDSRVTPATVTGGAAWTWSSTRSDGCAPA